MMLFRRQATDTVSEGERKVGSEWGGDKKTDEWSGCNDEGSMSGKASRDVSSAESGSATPLFEDEDDLYDPLDSLDCSV